jgi:RimK family alpha-L-glutamate ligase
MKKVLLLFSKTSVENGSADPSHLARLLANADADIEVSHAFFEDLLFHISEAEVQVIDTANNHSLTEYNVVYFRYWGDASVQGPALAAARFCKLKNITFVDSEVLRQGSFNKITQYMNLHEAGVPFPHTLVAPAGELLAHYKEHGFSFPLILKAASGTRGNDNFLVHTEEEMRQILEQNSNLTFVLQTFLPNDGDYRVVVMGGKAVLVIKRTASSDTHLNNTSQGGSAENVPVSSLPQEVRDLSVRAANFFGRQIAGVDMVQSSANGRWYCFEVNRAPQIEHASFEHEKAVELAKYLHSLDK